MSGRSRLLLCAEHLSVRSQHMGQWVSPSELSADWGKRMVELHKESQEQSLNISITRGICLNGCCSASPGLLNTGVLWMWLSSFIPKTHLCFFFFSIPINPWVSICHYRNKALCMLFNLSLIYKLFLSCMHTVWNTDVIYHTYIVTQFSYFSLKHNNTYITWQCLEDDINLFSY